MRLISAAAIVGLTTLLLAGSAMSAIVLEEDFEQQGKWKKNVRGKGVIELVPGGVEGKCLKVTSEEQALAYYTTVLDIDRVRGKKLIVRARVRLENVVQGPKSYSTAKIHIGVTVGGKTQHRAQRFLGTADWHEEVMLAPVPKDAAKVVLDLGIQNGTGTAWFDNLVVDDGVAEHLALNIKPVANTSYRDEVAGDGKGGFIDTGPTDLRDVPVANVRLAGADFYVMYAGENFGRTCVTLRGRKRPELPKLIETVIPVGEKAFRLFFLHAAAWASTRHRSPCLVYELHYADGKSLQVPMREGVDIGAFENPKELRNWKVAWTSKRNGRTVGLGVTTWENPKPEVRIEFIRLRTPGTGAVPIVVAISLDQKK